jgi:hypothetical protein
MRHFDKIFLLLILLASCNSSDKKTIDIPSGWKEIRLQSNWTLLVPDRFENVSERGVDSNPGGVISRSDSIAFTYDSGFDLLSKDTCDISFQIKRAYKKMQLYDTLYKNQKITMDTINNRIAILVTPYAGTKDIMRLSIRDCESGAWLSLMTKIPHERQKKLVQEIFNTVDYKIGGHK